MAEDDAVVMKLTDEILDGLNYTVLTAQARGEAMVLAKRHAEELSFSSPKS